MDVNLRMSILRRREDMYNFYYQGIGQRIKKRRIELNLTQEALAKGICSNTYISKLENNKIVINKEHLYLIMERMGLPIDRISFPEKMVEILEKSIEYFFYKDVEAYSKLMNEIEKFEFGVLIYVSRLGYYVLTEDLENAKIIYDDMYRYLNSLEDFGFATFLIFGGFYNIAIHDYQTARMIIESVQDKLKNDEMLFSLYSYIKFVVYGHLGLINSSRDSLYLARQIFMNYGNASRLNDTCVYVNVFNVYEKSYKSIPFNINQFQSLNKTEINDYIITLSFSTKEPIKYLSYLEEKGQHYLAGLFLKARYYFKNHNLDEYNKVKNIINKLHYESHSEIDYGNLLKLYENSEKYYLKDYLINYILPWVTKLQNLYLMKLVTNQISNILVNKKRYKDALNYYIKFEEIKTKLQLENKSTLKKAPQF